MKKAFLFLAALGLAGSSYAQTTPQLNDEEYAYVTMDLQGILNLTMTTDPNVGFSFKSVSDYRNGITKWNATKLEVDATVAWDLFAYANTDRWTQVDQFSTNGTADIPAEILQMQSVSSNVAIPDPAQNLSFNSFTSLRSKSRAGIVNGVPTTNDAQFLAGAFGQGAGSRYEPGSSLANPTTNQFRVHYRLVPGIPASFRSGTVLPAAHTLSLAGEYAQAGHYYLEVVYALVEDL